MFSLKLGRVAGCMSRGRFVVVMLNVPPEHSDGSRAKRSQLEK